MTSETWKINSYHDRLWAIYLDQEDNKTREWKVRIEMTVSELVDLEMLVKGKPVTACPWPKYSNKILEK